MAQSSHHNFLKTSAVSVAIVANSSAPGQVGPIFVNDLIWKDGGIYQTSTHSDMTAGVKQLLIFSLGDGPKIRQKEGLRLSNLPNPVNQEIKALEVADTKTKYIIADLSMMKQFWL
jgi:NTE family protein